MKTCVYDNPSTLRREAWMDGKMVAFISMALMYSKGRAGSPFNGFKTLPFFLNVGRDFIDGRVIGDPEAMGL
jgi:hypothetical protein